jgi:pimeloyl-ACP methyl ester carboxylesterase
LGKLGNLDLPLEYKILGKGEKTLLIETGIGSSIYNWFPFVDNIKKDFTIMLYHRAGYGSSIASKEPRTTKNIANDLNNLLEIIGIKEKVTMLGHSFGGLCALHYVMLYPERVDGPNFIGFNFPEF